MRKYCKDGSESRVNNGNELRTPNRQPLICPTLTVQVTPHEFPTLTASICQDNSIHETSPLAVRVGPSLGTTYRRTCTLLFLVHPFPQALSSQNSRFPSFVCLFLLSHRTQDDTAPSSYPAPTVALLLTIHFHRLLYGPPPNILANIAAQVCHRPDQFSFTFFFTFHPFSAHPHT